MICKLIRFLANYYLIKERRIRKCMEDESNENLMTECMVERLFLWAPQPTEALALRSVFSRKSERISSHFRSKGIVSTLGSQQLLTFYIERTTTNEQLPKFLTMLSWHQSHTMAENCSSPCIELTPHTAVWVQSSKT